MLICFDIGTILLLYLEKTVLLEVQNMVYGQCRIMNYIVKWLLYVYHHYD